MHGQRKQLFKSPLQAIWCVPFYATNFASQSNLQLFEVTFCGGIGMACTGKCIAKPKNEIASNFSSEPDQ
eukprot:1156503-Pelagomonas_calceolata.AAC.12